MKYFNIFSQKTVLLIALFAFSLTLRSYNLNWDSGNHLHPDERMIVMVAEKITMPSLPVSPDLYTVVNTLFSPSSPLNPKFFAYGSLPLYLLKFTASLVAPVVPGIDTYASLNLLGRVLSALFDSFSVLLLYFIAFQLFKSSKIAILSAFFYATAVLPVQLSHFYAVDTGLNFFILLTLYQLLLLNRHPSLKRAFLVSLCFGSALATKVSAVVLIFPLVVALLINIFLTLKYKIVKTKAGNLSKIKNYFISLFKPSFWNYHAGFLGTSFSLVLVIVLLSSLVFIIFEPFAFFDFFTFWRQLNDQKAMTKDAFVFPYTLQYVNTPAFIYPLKNILFWGLGPFVTVTSLFGLVILIRKFGKKTFVHRRSYNEAGLLIVSSFILVYFAITGSSAVKFMRYYLPLYPFICLFSAYFLITFKKGRWLYFPVVGFQIIWLVSFLSIYTQNNTRVTASNWLNQNAAPASLILREHWDDGLPLSPRSDLILKDLPLYEPDSSAKWQNITSMLNSADYLVIASNRLYTPLQKLTDCQRLPPGKCYPQTADYYKNLFAGRLNYTKVAEFSSYPRLFSFSINDQSADESFTVYDHPKIMIFKKK